MSELDLTEFKQANQIATELANVMGRNAPGVATHVLMLATSILDVMNHRLGAGGHISRADYLKAAASTYDALNDLIAIEPMSNEEP